VKEVQNLLLLLPHSNGDSAVHIMLSKKSLRIMADSAGMLDALPSLVRHALDAIPDGGICSLSLKQVTFKNQVILEGDNGVYGACASIAVARTGRGVDEKTGKNMVKSPCATRAGAVAAQRDADRFSGLNRESAGIL
jgi:hypothetical protein